MKNPKWTATKKEFTFNAEGKEMPDKITYEKVQRNWLDLIVKSIGIFAIFIPLLLIYLQKNTEIKLENARNRSELYTVVLTDLQIIMDDYDYSKDFESAVKNIQFKYKPKVQLINDVKLNVIYSEIINSTVHQNFLLYYVNLCRRLSKERQENVDDFLDVTTQDVITIKAKKTKDVLVKDINKLISDIKELQDYGWDDRKRSGIKFYRDSLMEISNRSIAEMRHLRDYLEYNDEKSKNQYLKYRYPTKSQGDLGDLIYTISVGVRKNANKINDSKKKFEESLLELL